MTLAEEIQAEAAAREDDPGFPRAVVERVRAATARLAATAVRPDDVHHASLLVEQAAAIDVHVPTTGRFLPLTLAKRVLKKAMFFYIAFLANQVSLLGHAAARLGLAVAERTDGLEAELASLRRRVDELEARLGGGTGGEQDGAARP